MAKWKEWGDVFNHYCSKGLDHSDAAYRADQWQDRQEHVIGACRHEWDWRVPETLEEIIQLIERRIEVHALWRDWLKTNPPEATAKGTAKSNQRYIDQYEGLITVIKHSFGSDTLSVGEQTIEGLKDAIASSSDSPESHSDSGANSEQSQNTFNNSVSSTGGKRTMYNHYWSCPCGDGFNSNRTHREPCHTKCTCGKPINYTVKECR